MKEFLKDILLYNFSMNEELLNYFEKNHSKISEKAHLLLTHLINAQHLWNRRIISEDLVYGIWETFPYETLRKINTENLENSKNILNENDLERVIFYKNIKGKKLPKKTERYCFSLRQSFNLSQSSNCH